MAHCNWRYRLGSPAGILKVEATEPVARNNQQEVIWARLCDFLAKQDAVSAERKDEVSAFEGLADCAVRKLRIEVSGAVKADQTGNNPVAPDLRATAHACGVKV